MKNSIDKEGLNIIERLQVKKQGTLFKMGSYATLLLLLTFVPQLFLQSDRPDGNVFLFFAGLDIVILAQFVLFVKERNKSKLSGSLLSTLLKTTKGCCWVWNAATQRFCSFPESHAFFGRDIETYEDFIILIHPDDADAFQEAVLHFYSSLCPLLHSSSPSPMSFPDEMFEMEFRARVGGDWRWFVVRSGFVECVSNKIARITGSVLDIDTYKRAIEAARSSAEATHSSNEEKIKAMRSSIKAMRSSAENQRWLFDFLQHFNQFDGIVELFKALKDNLPKVISFSSLSLVVPSFLDRAWALDSMKELDVAETYDAVHAVLLGEGPLGQAYINRTPVTWYESFDKQSILAVPLIYKEKTWGVMKLERIPSHIFTDQGITLMSILGGNIGLYFTEQSDRSELDIHAQHLQRLHSLIYSLLRTQNRDHLLDGMLQYLREVVSNSVCVVYLFVNGPLGSPQLERLSGYEEEGIPLPSSALVLDAITHKTSLVEYNERGMETRRVSPLIFQTHSVGAIDLYKPSGLLPTELKMYQLLADYVAGFWMLSDLMALREEEAFIDPLTGIWNRRYMIRRLQEESERIARYGGNACLVIGDVGNFKHTNDNYGHTKGDEVLVKSAAVIKKNLRISDSVGRYGGDEFILLLPNISRQDTDAVLNRITLELENLHIKSDDTDPDSDTITVVIDFGSAIYPGKAATLMETINVADEAMYANKIERKKQRNEVSRV